MIKIVRNILPILLLALVMISCASVRSRNSAAKDSANSKKTNSKVAKNQKMKPAKFVQNSSAKGKDRFADTTFVYLNDEAPADNSTSESSAKEVYTKAIEKYNNADYNTACNDLKSFLDMYQEKDDTYYDAKYHLGECLVLNNSLDEAISIFSTILDSQNVPNETIQQTLVRMGQVYCMQNKMSLAQRNFTRLKNEYPNSRYLPLATCE